MTADHFGAHVAADGFSAPCRVAMALATSLYGFLGLWLSFSLTREHFPEKWAFLSTIGIWGASSLPVYMYFNPSWSHAHSVFAVVLFLWYWHRNRARRRPHQWRLLGLLSGLMVDVYYPNGVFLLIPLMEAVSNYAREWNPLHDRLRRTKSLLFSHALYVVTFIVGLLPTLVSRLIIFGSALKTGYFSARSWKWSSPALWAVLWSSDHGLLSWTPIVILALAGLGLFYRKDRSFGVKLIVCAFAFYLLIAFYPDWDGLASFGNRFFISMTPLFILGLAASFDWLTRVWNQRRATAAATALIGLLILWNFGMMYQWGVHLIPARVPISWRQAVYNQFAVVPGSAYRNLEDYLTRRGRLIQRIEDEDIKQLKSQHPN